MAKRPNLGQISSSVFTVSQLNDAYGKIDTAFDNTLSRDGSTPNTMLADLDMNSNSLLNVDDIQAQTITVESAIIGGKEFVGTITWRASWLTGTAYDYLDVVNKDGVLYICLEAHTSDVFMTDLTNTKWEVFISNTTGPTGDPGADGQGVPVGGTAGQVLAKVDGTDYNTEWVDSSGGAGITDGDKGDITVSASGATWTIDNNVVTLAKMADMVTSSLIYRKTAGSGAPEVNTLATLKTDLGLTGTNSGDQTSIVGITGSKAQFDTAVTDGNFMYVGDAPTSHTHTASDITNFDNVSRSVVLSGYSASGSRLALAATDTILGAFDKIGKWLADLAAVAFSGSASDLTTGTLPIDRIADGSITLAKVQDLSNTVSNAALVDVPTGTIKGRATAGTGDPEDLTGTQATALLDAFTTTLKGLAPASGGGTANFLRADGTWATPLESITIALSDLTTAITAGTGKETIRMPYAFTVTAVRAYLATAQTSGSIFTVDINEGGVSILSTKLTIDNTEKTSVTAATAAVISDANLADDAEITFDVDQVGDGTAKGLKVVLIGYRT